MTGDLGLTEVAGKGWITFLTYLLY